MTYRFFLQCRIENPTAAVVTKITIMTNSTMTTVKIIPTELLCTVTDVGIFVVITVALSLESSVAKGNERAGRVTYMCSAGELITVYM